jgi:glycosyltransferase involved in cell wall biosynthesis
MRRVAALFDNFGPYHLARLEAAAKRCELLAIEVSMQSREYAWERTEKAGEVKCGFQRVCLLGGVCERDRGEQQEIVANRQIGSLQNRLAKVLDTFKPDAVAIPGWASRASLEAILWCGRADVPAVVMSESQATDARRGTVKEFIKRRLVRCFSAALVGGGSHRDYLVKLGMARDRVVCGYDAVDNEYFASGVERVRRDPGNERGDKNQNTNKKAGRYFLSAARFIEKKNLPGLLRAYANYRRLWEAGKFETSDFAQTNADAVTQGKPWDLVILGDGDLRPALESLVKELGLGGCVELPGFKQYVQLPAYYGAAGAFVHASAVEPWGLVVNEAMASGLPVLASDRCGCTAELVREGVNGFTFEPRDAAGLAGLMAKVSAPGFPLVEFGRASQRIIADWGVERFAAGLEKAVEAAVTGGRRIGLLDYWMVGIVKARCRILDAG